MTYKAGLSLDFGQSPSTSILCVQAANALASLRTSAGSSEPSLPDNVISTKVTHGSSNTIISRMQLLVVLCIGTFQREWLHLERNFSDQRSEYVQKMVVRFQTFVGR